MLRYSRLLDQLRGDPETLRKLRHEVEQLLLEQLNEHGIKSDQRRLSTNQLNQKLTILHKERENLARKHRNFMEIRDVCFMIMFLFTRIFLINRFKYQKGFREHYSNFNG